MTHSIMAHTKSITTLQEHVELYSRDFDGEPDLIQDASTLPGNMPSWAGMSKNWLAVTGVENDVRRAVLAVRRGDIVIACIYEKKLRGKDRAWHWKSTVTDDLQRNVLPFFTAQPEDRLAVPYGVAEAHRVEGWTLSDTDVLIGEPSAYVTAMVAQEVQEKQYEIAELRVAHLEQEIDRLQAKIDRLQAMQQEWRDLL